MMPMISPYAVSYPSKSRELSLPAGVFPVPMRPILPTASCRYLWPQGRQPVCVPRWRSAIGNPHGPYRRQMSKMNSYDKVPTYAVSGNREFQLRFEVGNFLGCLLVTGAKIAEIQIVIFEAL